MPLLYNSLDPLNNSNPMTVVFLLNDGFEKMGFEKSFDFVAIPVGVVQPFERCELLLRDKRFHT